MWQHYSHCKNWRLMCIFLLITLIKHTLIKHKLLIILKKCRIFLEQTIFLRTYIINVIIFSVNFFHELCYKCIKTYALIALNDYCYRFVYNLVPHPGWIYTEIIFFIFFSIQFDNEARLCLQLNLFILVMPSSSFSFLFPMLRPQPRRETCFFFYDDARLIRDKIGLSYDHETHLFLYTVRTHARISKLVSIGRI